MKVTTGSAVDREMPAPAGAKDPATVVSPKVAASGVGSAVATLLWLVLVKTVAKNTFSGEELAVLIGATATVLSTLFGYFVRDPLRQPA
jgi:hypothetical protein